MPSGSSNRAAGQAGEPLLSQDPHALREPRENNLERAIGHAVRERRKQLGLTSADLAAATGLSPGMLSKIENGNISPSLTTLQALAQALGDVRVAPCPVADGEVDRQQAVVGEGQCSGPEGPGRRRPTLPLDPFEDVVGRLPLPGLEQRRQQCAAVGGAGRRSAPAARAG